MATRILGPTDSRRRRRLLLGPVLLVTVVALLFTVGAQAVHAEGIFELDKNAVNSAATPGNDWDQVFANTANNCSALGAIACTFVNDPKGTTIFQTGGSKDINDIPQWRYTGGSVPDKDHAIRRGMLDRRAAVWPGIKSSTSGRTGSPTTAIP